MLFKRKILVVGYRVSYIDFSMGCVLLDTDTPDYSIAEFIFKTDKSLWLKYSSYSCVDILHRDFQINGWEYLFRF